MKVIRMMFAFASLAMVTASAATLASGQVGQVEAASGVLGLPGNHDFKVSLQGNPVQCGHQTWSYINASDPNYKAIVATVLTAKYSNSAISMTIAPDSAGNCQISYVTAN